MTAEDKEDVQKIQEEMVAGCEKVFDYIHESIMKPLPERLEGLACRYMDTEGLQCPICGGELK